jgi:hypothetical protein
MVVEVELLSDDWALIRQVLEAQGRDVDSGLPWLLEQGLEQFTRDEATWRSLEGRSDPDAEARRQELKRRETQALLVSMRARTVASEKLMHELSEKVHRLGTELRTNRGKMWPLRRETDALDTKLRSLQETLTGPAPASRRRQAPASWLARLLGAGKFRRE